MTRTKLTADNSINDAASYNTAVVQPGANTLVLAFVTNTRPFVNQPPATPTLTGNDLTWQQVQTIVSGGGNDRRLTCFRSMAPAPVAGEITIDFGGETQDYCAWSVFEYDNVDTTGSAGQAAIAQSLTASGNGAALTVNLAASADPTRNLSAGGIVLDLFANLVTPVDQGAGFTEIDEQTPTQFFGKGATLQTEDAAVFASGVAWTWNGAADAAAIAVEVKAAPVPAPTPPSPAPSPDPVEALVRRFEPVLFFHPQETFFPVDAKRYVENAALWAARSPFDTKNGWGGVPGDPFPRQPLVTAGKLAAMPGEPGTYLDTPSFLLDSPRDERFLELGGWKDKSEAHEAEVTDTSTNLYADRNAISIRYASEPPLKDGRFWYHAELYDTDRLTHLAAQVTAPDLAKLLERLTKPMLLCYYLFYPAHDQAVGKSKCGNVEASEVACHAGDWQCIAIMLEGDASGLLSNAKPKFFGHSGSRPLADVTSGTPVFPPHQFDDEGLTVMKVANWRPSTGMTANQPEVADDHPRLYVAQGSHSLYMTPGTHEVDPFAASPFDCGQFDTGSVLPDDGDDLAAAFGTGLAKLLGAGALNFGPISAAIAVIALGLEGLLPGPTGLDLDHFPDNANPDEAPATAGTGKTVQPAGVTLTDGGTDVQDWVAQQGLQLNGRRYDFLVDRTTQLWWPDDEGQTGFRGRWGQHVTSDFLPRRSGPKFPPYWKMFLLALADGDVRGLIDLTL